MIRYYCDACGMEIPPSSAHTQWIVEKSFDNGTTVRVELIRAVDGTWNGGHVCLPCLRTAVRDGSAEPK